MVLDMIAVMYHYVRPGTTKPPYTYYYLALDDFRKQLDFFEDQHHLINRETFIKWYAGERTLPDDAVILTFDDGLRDHYEYVLPELRSRDLWGLFFCPGPIDDQALTVHRIHTLLGTVSASTLDEALRELVKPTDLRSGTVSKYEQMYSVYDSDEAMKRVKRTLNFFLPYESLTTVLTRLEHRFVADPIDPSEFYLSPEEINTMADHGMLMGGHTISHRVLSRLSPDQQREEIGGSLEYIRDATNSQPITSFSFPYGGAETYDQSTKSALEDEGCDIAFTTTSGEITDEGLHQSPLELPRKDCNEFPHGSASR